MKHIFGATILGVFLTACRVTGAGDLAADFRSPPPSTRAGCYWYFLKDDVSKEGITRDLEAMARVGIGRAFVGYINQGDNPAGDNHVLSDVWWDRLEHTFLEGERLGVDIGMFNCPGWSQSGGPWIPPSRSMRNLVSTELRILGPQDYSGPLPSRDGYFETVRVVAFPTPGLETVTMKDYGVAISGPAAPVWTSPFAGGSIGFRAALRYPGDPGNPTGLVRSVRVFDASGNLLFRDDFSGDLANWDDVGGSTVDDGVMHPLLIDGIPTHVRELRLPAAFAFETTVKILPEGVLGIALGVKDAANYAFWQVRKGMLRPHVRQNDRYIIRDVPVSALVEDQWLRVRIVSDGMAVETTVDDRLVDRVVLADMTEKNDVNALFDGDPTTAYTFPRLGRANAFLDLDFVFARPYPVQSVIATPQSGNSGLTGDLYASDDGEHYRKLCGVAMFHGHQGVKITEPMVATVPASSARYYRLRLTQLAQNRAFTSLTLSPRAMLEKYVIKQLGDIHPTPAPVYGTYEWKLQAEPTLPDSVMAPGTVLDISDRLDDNGVLHWQVPEGDWTIARFGMVSTGSRNGPAMPDATGLECDKMSSEHIRYHVDSYIGAILKRIPPGRRKSFRYVIQDSYEQGPQNWTDGLAEAFRSRYGYDPTSYLPVSTGRLVGSADQSERFLWDLRRLVADRIASEYVGGLTSAVSQHGLTGWLENYGHWGFPGESLLYGKYTDEVAGEFWLGGDLGAIECRLAASCAHIYGKKEVYAEAFTSGLRYIQTPRSHLKHYGDWAFCEGINHFILHVAIHQPREDEAPGVDAWFGTNFNRHNTWFELSKGYIDYTRRVNVLMTRGTSVADVCYFIGEGTPKMDGPRRPLLPRGFDFDFVNGDVIMNRMTVAGGRMCLSDGPSYGVMVLPDVDAMRPEIAARLLAFVDGGAVICGPRPSRSPSMENYPRCDQDLARYVEALWGAGRVMPAGDLVPALDRAGLTPDFSYHLADAEIENQESPYTDLGYASHAPRNALRFAHRRDGDVEIYFVANMRTAEAIDAQCEFRVEHKQPEIWDPVDGTMREAAAYALTDNGVSMPMRFAPQQSFLFVFRTPVVTAGSRPDNEQATETVTRLGGDWTVHFDPKRGGPGDVSFAELGSWTERDEEGIRYYSGEAVYEKTFHFAGSVAGRHRLNLGGVGDLAEVTLNDTGVGIVWVEPWCVDITPALVPGTNRLRIKIANTWNNRFYGDRQGQSRHAVSTTPFAPRSLVPSGLFGPVTIESVGD